MTPDPTALPTPVGAAASIHALGVAFAAIAMLVREPGSTIATVAAVVGGLAGFCGGLANVLVGYDLAAAATAHTSPFGGLLLHCSWRSMSAVAVLEEKRFEPVEALG